MSIDIIFAAVFVFGFWQGYMRGIIGTVFNFMAYVFGAVISFKMAPVTANVLERLFNTDNPALYIAGLVTNLVVIMIIMRQAAKGMEGIFEAVYLGMFNKIAGGFLTAATLVLAYSVVLWFLAKVQFLGSDTMATSRTYPYLEPLPGKAKNVAVRFKPLLQDFWGNSINLVDRLEQYGIQKTQTKPKVYEIPDEGSGIEDNPESSTPYGSRQPANADNGGIEE